MEVLVGPIPGENYTSDTKNYPWHRPPEYDDLTKAMDYVSKKLTNKNTSISMMTLAKSGVPLSMITQMFLMSGVMRGKWTVDYALLMAGPTTHILSLMAKAGSISHSLGIEDEETLYPSAYFEAMAELDEKEKIKTETMGDILSMGSGLEGSETPLEGSPMSSNESLVPSTGFAGAPPGGPSGVPSEASGFMSGAPEENPTDQMPEVPDINMV